MTIRATAKKGGGMTVQATTGRGGKACIPTAGARGGGATVQATAGRGSLRSRLLGGGLHALLRLLMASIRIRWTDDEHQLAATKDGPCIYALWHGNQLPLLVPFRGSGRSILISWSRDGMLLDHVARALGYRTVRGSSSRGASEAMVALREELDAGRSVILAVDGPRGPARVAKRGAIRLAEATGRPILPIGSSGPGIRLKTWDRFFIPFPFGRLVIRRGAPVSIAKRMAPTPDEVGENRLAEALNALERPLTDSGRFRGGGMVSYDSAAGKKVAGGTTSTPAGPGPWSALYSGLTRCLEVLVTPVWRLGTARGWRWCQHGLERLGLYSDGGEHSPCVWIHAASLGEVNVARSFLSCLERVQRPEKVVVTCTSLPGRATAARLPGSRACLAPFDLPSCLRRAFHRLKPRAIVLVETEIWPGLLRAAHISGTPVAIINARISEGLFSSYHRWRGLFGPLLEPVHVLARTEGDAGRLCALGVSRERCRVGGDFKLLKNPAPDITLPGPLVDWLRSGQIFVAASTHAGEHELILQALEPLWARWPHLKLVLAPRHPERFDLGRRRDAGVGALWAADLAIVQDADAGIGRISIAPSLERRSQLDRTPTLLEGARGLLLDTLGELQGFYPHAFAVFVGGTFCEGVGGHNLLEVARAARVCLYGPHTEGVSEQADLLEKAGAGLRCDGPETLRSLIETLLADPANADARGRAGLDTVSTAEAALRANVQEWLEDWFQLPKPVQQEGGGGRL